jgi:hypothetical protein
MKKLIALVAAGAFAVTAATATAAKPDSSYFIKINQQCTSVRIASSVGWSADYNPSYDNAWWRMTDCGVPTQVSAGVLR